MQHAIFTYLICCEQPQKRTARLGGLLDVWVEFFSFLLVNTHILQAAGGQPDHTGTCKEMKTCCLTLHQYGAVRIHLPP